MIGPGDAHHAEASRSLGTAQRGETSARTRVLLGRLDDGVGRRELVERRDRRARGVVAAGAGDEREGKQSAPHGSSGYTSDSITENHDPRDASSVTGIQKSRSPPHVDANATQSSDSR